jgi:hypothetical protein
MYTYTYVYVCMYTCVCSYLLMHMKSDENWDTSLRILTMLLVGRSRKSGSIPSRDKILTYSPNSPEPFWFSPSPLTMGTNYALRLV